MQVASSQTSVDFQRSIGLYLTKYFKFTFTEKFRASEIWEKLTITQFGILCLALCMNYVV